MATRENTRIPITKPAPIAEPTPITRPVPVPKPTPIRKQVPVPKPAPSGPPTPRSIGSSSVTHPCVVDVPAVQVAVATRTPFSVPSALVARAQAGRRVPVSYGRCLAGEPFRGRGCC
jgi:hypothetical protein